MSELAKGRKISKETLLKMNKRIVSEKVKSSISTALKGREFSKNTRELISKALLGCKRNKYTLLKMAFSNYKRQPIIITNIETGIFPFMKEAAEYQSTSHTTIRNS